MENSNKNKWLYFFSILFLLMLEPYTYISMYKIPQNISFVIKITVLFMGYLFAVIARKKRIRISRHKQMVMLIFIGSLLFNKLITGDGSNFYFTLSATIVIAYLATGILKFDIFKESYTKVLTFLCVYSLISTYLIIFLLDYFQWLPSVTYYFEGNLIHLINAGLNFVYIPEYGVQYRNYSIFREPGVFQFYIIIALIFELWFKNEQPRKSRIVIYSITLISTFSTTGIIVGMIILISYIFNFIKNSKSMISALFGVSLTILVFAAIYHYIPFVKDNLSESFDKLFNGSGSTLSRTSSLRAYFSAWLNKPIWGWGYTAGVFEAGDLYLREYTKDNTNTTFTNLAFFGLIYGMIYQVYLFKFAFLPKKRMATKLIIALVLILCINSQRFIESTLIFMLIFYSVPKDKRELQYRENQIEPIPS